MRRTTRTNGTRCAAGLLAALVLAAVAAAPVAAKAKPKKVTFFLHGYERLGEQELPDWPTWTPERLWKPMDRKAPPADAVPKSMFVTNGGQVTPNDSCSGNPYYPVWDGDVAGTLSDIEVELHTVAGPDAALAVSLFRDLESADCHRQDPTGSIVPPTYKPPLAVEVVEVPAGTGTVTADFGPLAIEVYEHLVVQVQVYDQRRNPADQVRLLYDSEDFPAKISFLHERW